MTVSRSNPAHATPTEEASRLLGMHGELMDSRALAAFFKFGSDRSFRRSADKGSLPVRVFRIRGRKGWFARTADVARWLTTADQGADKRTSQATGQLPEGGAI